MNQESLTPAKVPTGWVRKYCRTRQPEGQIEEDGSWLDSGIELCYMPDFFQRPANQQFRADEIADDLSGGFFLEPKGDSFYYLIGLQYLVGVKAAADRFSGDPIAIVRSVRFIDRISRLPGAVALPVWLRDIRDKGEYEGDGPYCDLPRIEQAIRARQLRESAIDHLRTVEQQEEFAERAELMRRAWHKYGPLLSLLELFQQRSIVEEGGQAEGRVVDPAEAAANRAAEGEEDEASSQSDRLFVRVSKVQGTLEEGSRVRVERLLEKRKYSMEILEIQGDLFILQPVKRVEFQPGETLRIERANFGMQRHLDSLKDRFLRGDVEGKWEDLVRLLCQPKALELSPTDPSQIRFFADVEAQQVKEEERQVLNDEQRRAVAGALDTPHAFFIQGPPGTGKTTVIVELVRQLAERGERVLLLAPTHVAVDEVLRRAGHKDGLLPLRLAYDVDRIHDDVKRFAPQHMCEEFVRRLRRPSTSRAKQWRARLEQLAHEVQVLQRLEDVPERYLRANSACREATEAVNEQERRFRAWDEDHRYRAGRIAQLVSDTDRRLAHIHADLPATERLLEEQSVQVRQERDRLRLLEHAAGRLGSAIVRLGYAEALAAERRHTLENWLQQHSWAVEENRWARREVLLRYRLCFRELNAAIEEEEDADRRLSGKRTHLARLEHAAGQMAEASRGLAAARTSVDTRSRLLRDTMRDHAKRARAESRNLASIRQQHEEKCAELGHVTAEAQDLEAQSSHRLSALRRLCEAAARLAGALRGVAAARVAEAEKACCLQRGMREYDEQISRARAEQDRLAQLNRQKDTEIIALERQQKGADDLVSRANQGTTPRGQFLRLFGLASTTDLSLSAPGSGNGDGSPPSVAERLLYGCGLARIADLEEQARRMRSQRDIAAGELRRLNKLSFEAQHHLQRLESYARALRILLEADCETARTQRQQAEADREVAWKEASQVYAEVAGHSAPDGTDWAALHRRLEEARAQSQRADVLLAELGFGPLANLLKRNANTWARRAELVREVAALSHQQKEAEQQHRASAANRRARRAALRQDLKQAEQALPEAERHFQEVWPEGRQALGEALGREADVAEDWSALRQCAEQVRRQPDQADAALENLGLGRYADLLRRAHEASARGATLALEILSLGIRREKLRRRAHELAREGRTYQPELQQLLDEAEQERAAAEAEHHQARSEAKPVFQQAAGRPLQPNEDWSTLHQCIHLALKQPAQSKGLLDSWGLGRFADQQRQLAATQRRRHQLRAEEVWESAWLPALQQHQQELESERQEQEPIFRTALEQVQHQQRQAEGSLHRLHEEWQRDWRELGWTEHPSPSQRQERRAANAEEQTLLERYLSLEQDWFELTQMAARSEEEIGRQLEEVAQDLKESANLYCATTTGIAGSPEVQFKDFDTLIIDEASRVTDAEFLIGAVRARRWILVGDEKQLPPYVEQTDEHHLHALMALHRKERGQADTLDKAVEDLMDIWEAEEELHAYRKDSVLGIAEALFANGSPESSWAKTYRPMFGKAYASLRTVLEQAARNRRKGKQPEPDVDRFVLLNLRKYLVRSLFERGVKKCRPELSQALIWQRRMVDAIARTVRQPIYGGQYQTPYPLKVKSLPRTNILKRPVFFLDTSGHGQRARAEQQGNGFINPLECDWIVRLCRHLDRDLSELVARGREGSSERKRLSVSVLCFYLAQARLIRERLGGPALEKNFRNLHFEVIGAIDRIQGQESDLVIISFTRTHSNPKENFARWLQDPRRLNVACTRARRGLVFVGQAQMLRRLRGVPVAVEFYKDLFEHFQNDVDFGMAYDLA